MDIEGSHRTLQDNNITFSVFDSIIPNTPNNRFSLAHGTILAWGLEKVKGEDEPQAVGPKPQAEVAVVRKPGASPPPGGQDRMNAELQTQEIA